MNPVTLLKIWAIICLDLIGGGYNLEVKEGLQNSDNEEAKESKICAAAAADQLTDVKLEKLIGDVDLSEDPKWEAADSPHLWKKTAPLAKRRVEIHPKFEGKVTLSQIEKECEESMRKQLKENQHKKKLQFSFIGKRNDTQQSASLDQNELHEDKGGLTLLEDNNSYDHLENWGREKRDQSTQSSAPKPPNKNWSKSDELRRLQKVATELKCKIDDLLQNLEGTVSDAEEDDEEDDEDDDDDDEDDEALVKDVNNTSMINNISAGARRVKVNEDPFESFKKFKSRPEDKMDKRKFKEYEPKGRLNKIVGKKPITMSSRYKSAEDKSKSKKTKSKREKREDNCEQFHDKYDIYNFKPSRRENGDDIDAGKLPLGNVMQDCNYNSVYTGLANNDKEYPSCRSADNNFNVLRLTSDVKKVFEDVMQRQREASPRNNGFQKYFGNNHQQLRERAYDIRKYSNFRSKAKSGKMKINENNDEEMKNDIQGLK